MPLLAHGCPYPCRPVVLFLALERSARSLALSCWQLLGLLLLLVLAGEQILTCRLCHETSKMLP